VARDYKELIEEESPPWLLSADGTPFMRSIGAVKDSMVWRMQQAVMSRFPSFGTASAVGRRGAERGIPRALGESLASYAGRVRGAWTSWSYAGTALGMLRAFYDSGYADHVQLAIFNRRRYYLTPVTRALNEVALGPHSWLFRATSDTYWARFIVLFPQPLLPRWVTDGVPGQQLGRGEPHPEHHSQMETVAHGLRRDCHRHERHHVRLFPGRKNAQRVGARHARYRRH
jgi:hypothetical protein